jgi:hypothetical protein
MMSLSHSRGVSLTMLATLISVAAPTQAQRWMENLDRGVVAINQGSDGVFVGWRLLGTDPIDLGFNVYRQSGNGEPVKLNQQPLTGPTHFRDIAADLSQPTQYLVRPVTADKEAEARGSFRLPANPPERRYLSIPLQTPDGYHANDASTGDLDGDGQLDLVVHMVGRGRDNSQSGLTTEPVLHAYQLDGTLLWSINLGKNVREGAHYTQFMVFDFDSDVVDPSKQMWRGQGNHSIAVADVDEDGRDEIVYGSLVVDDDGTALYSTGLGHGDAQHTTDLDPSRPGLEIWSIHEKPAADRPGVELRNSRTGEIYFDAAHGIDVARGMAADIDPRHPGCEVWGGSNNLFSASGEDLGPRPRSQNMAIWWDGDLLREMLDGVRIVKWDYENGRDVSLFNGREEGVAANNGTKSNPCLSVDILGDWREELIARSADNSEIRIYVSTISTEYRLYTLMHDPIYRLSIAWQNVGYNQPPHPGFFLGDGMAAAPRPNIRLTRTGERPD